MDGPVVLILMNIISSVSIVNVNKILVENFSFKYVILLSALHFLAGYGFLSFASSNNCSMFPRKDAKKDVVWKMAAAGVGSIVLLNYSLRLNAVGTYQILKVAVLPVVMALSYLQNVSTPTRDEIGAAACVVIGACICTASDVSLTFVGLTAGVLAVVSTAQYQIYQGSVQKLEGLSSVQAMYIMSLPQAILGFVSSILIETNWTRVYNTVFSARGGIRGAPSVFIVDEGLEASEGASTSSVGVFSGNEDIWSHPYSLTEFVVIFATCVLAIILNYSTIGVIGKTSAVTMQFVNQAKTVLIIAISFVLFPKPMSTDRIVWLVIGLVLVFLGVGWYTKLKNSGK
jgi:solute carrier family 35, member E3